MTAHVELAVESQARTAKEASRQLASMEARDRILGLRMMASELLRNQAAILEANRLDVDESLEAGLPQPLVKRLLLTPEKISIMAEGLLEIAELPEVVGEVIETIRRPNGLVIRKIRVPFGVVGIIYESRPNVTSDAAGLCIKSANAVILRGGKEAFRSNRAIVEALRAGLRKARVNPECIQLVADHDRSAALKMMTMRDTIDLLIPRGGPALIKSVVENAKVPVIETGVGNCHVYVDKSADLDKAEAIVVNAKCSNPAVCNAAETLLVHREIAPAFLPKVKRLLEAAGVQLRGCPATLRILPDIEKATEADWETEYLDLILAVKIVNSLEEAIDHINTYGTKHSEAIITEDPRAANLFQTFVDAACVYVNASTRFTDGYEFGFGAEIGISTQKLHARGPMGIRELTTYKYLVDGTGQVRH
ncbi:MAG: glutamate-5-semialdehyde dehydrogenase [Candidatus Fermentithermobacillus carboniphilus]|uniref:Gamma-glutamyl phosphate reductase n=1 Tax=Candidatus Fermentithermobacillus carboniphilus TaxID=3085328 RepID=A0AAT9LDQ8_9FIRM|nr:MAG: glutamate-5-semialdehyde dehydrogenase [Candidatus Fermentithermobacillus carboniphilus]